MLIHSLQRTTFGEAHIKRVTKQNFLRRDPPQVLTTGSVAEYTCNEHYKQNATGRSTCGADGKWSPVQCYPGNNSSFL